QALEQWRLSARVDQRRALPAKAERGGQRVVQERGGERRCVLARQWRHQARLGDARYGGLADEDQGTAHRIGSVALVMISTGTRRAPQPHTEVCPQACLSRTRIQHLSDSSSSDWRKLVCRSTSSDLTVR